jgi:hypothetical protein
MKIFTFNTFSTRKFWTTKDNISISFIKFIQLNTTLLTDLLGTSQSECHKNDILSTIPSFPGGIIALIKMFSGQEDPLDLMEPNFKLQPLDFTISTGSQMSTSIRLGTTRNSTSFSA